MKKVRIISLLLVLCLVLSLAYPLPAKAAEDNGMVINKTATANSNGTYTIQLEAYATGSKIITETTKDKPTDIILVLDQSGSMARCIVCGQSDNNYHYTYTFSETTHVTNNGEYYIKTDNNTYTKVEYCNGTHSLMWETWECSGKAGWYVADGYSSDHTPDAKITPKNTANPNGTQFYTKSDGTRENCESRLSALKSAVTTFANSVATKAAGADGQPETNDDVNHRIAMVGFASETGDGDNTELLSIAGYNSSAGNNNYVGVAYNRIENQNLKNVLQSMNTAAGRTMVNNAINALTANGATEIDLGMDMAERILNANQLTDGEDRNRVVVVFTDGSPTASNGFERTVANSAINIADAIKDSGITVYSVGVFAGADASSAGTQPSSDLSSTSSSLPAASNWFMQKLSSNNGTPQNPSYYLSAGDAETLNNIFQQISDQIESGDSASKLSSESVVKDIIAPGFKLPANASAGSITLKTFKCTGKSDGKYTWSENEDAMGATATVNGDTVDVTGFDFSKNYVAEIKTNGEVTGYMGNKLVISFTVERKPEYLGGNGVETNASAGIYENANAEKPIVTFPKPVVNVPINPVVVANADDQNVYLYDSLTGLNLKEDATVTVGDVELDLTQDNYGLADWQTADVNISVEITDAEGNDVTDNTFANLTEDSEYNVSVTVSPKQNAEANKPERGPAATEQQGADSAQINVFKPVITFNDTAIDLGTTAVYANNGGTINEWVHTVENKDGIKTVTKSTDTGVVMDTAEPTDITYTYSIPAAAFTEEKEVKVTVARGNSGDLSNHVTFYRDACTFNGCTHKSKAIVPSVDNRVNFKVHINTFDLTIEKKGVDSQDGNAPFVFRVSGGDVSMDVVIYGNSSVTIENLPSGTYTVEEINGYWRYEIDAENSAKEQAVTANGPTATVTFVNKRTENKWLDDWAKATNNFGGSAIKDSGIADN